MSILFSKIDQIQEELNDSNTLEKLNELDEFIKTNPQCLYDISPDNLSVLKYVIRIGNLNILKFIIENHKIDPCVSTSYIKPSNLHFASANGCLPIVKYLITDCKCDVNECLNSFSSFNPFFIALAKGYCDIVRYFTEACDLSLKLEENSCLHLACQYGKSGHFEMVRFFIEECGMDPHAKKKIMINSLSKRTHTALECAVFGGNIEIFRYLIEEQRCKHDLNLLVEASKWGEMDVVKYLVEKHNYNPMHSCDVILCKHDLCSALYMSMRFNRLNVIQYFLYDVNCSVSDSSVIKSIIKPGIKKILQKQPLPSVFVQGVLKPCNAMNTKTFAIQRFGKNRLLDLNVLGIIRQYYVAA